MKTDIGGVFFDFRVPYVGNGGMVMKVSDKIQELRKSAGYSQEKLAELLHVSRQAVSKWEAGAALPTLDNLIELSKLFSVPLDTLTGTAQESGTQEEQNKFGDVPQPEPHRVKRQRNIAFGLAGMLLVVLLISIWVNAVRLAGLTNQMAELSARISALESRSWSSVQSAPVAQSLPVAGWQAENSLVADFTCEFERYDPKTGMLTMSLSVTPKVYAEGIAAAFTVAASEMETIEVPGETGPGNAFSAILQVPIVEELRLSVAFIEDGEAHTQLLDTIDSLKNYQMQVQSVFNGSVRRSGESITLPGEVVTYITPVDFVPGSREIIMGDPWNYPVSGKVELLADGTAVASAQMPIDDLYTQDAAGAQPIPTGETTFYTRFTGEISVPKGSELILSVTVLDNFDVVHTQEIPLSE